MVLSNDTILIREGQLQVKIIDTEGAVVAVIPLSDWIDVSNFFEDISNDLDDMATDDD